MCRPHRPAAVNGAGRSAKGTGSVRRLTYIASSPLPSRAANAVHVMKMASAFVRCGAEVQLVAQKAIEADAEASDLYEAYGVDPDFSLRLLPKWPLLRPRQTYPLVSVIAAMRWRSELVYTRFPRAAVLAERLGLRAVVELHHPGALQDVRRYLAIARRPLVIVITHTLRRHLLAELDCPPEAVMVAPDGSDPVDPSLAPALPALPDGRLRVGFLGHLYRGKGMEVISQVAPRCPFVEFTVVGGTEADIATWRDRCRGMTNLTFHGYVPHAATPAMLRSFDIALLPSQASVATAGATAGPDMRDIGPYASPLKAFEYMAAGLPIIASDLENLREVFRDGENALLCPADEPEAWVRSIHRLAHDPGLRQRLARQSLDDHTRHYSWSARAERLMQAMASRFDSRE